MEAPGLDLGGSGLDFRRFWTSQTMPEGFSWVANALPPTCPASLGRSRAKSDRDVAKSQDVCLECLCFRVLAAMGEVLTEWGGRRCPPPGGFQWNSIFEAFFSMLFFIAFGHPILADFLRLRTRKIVIFPKGKQCFLENVCFR